MITTCPACGHENREGRKFCAECGSPLASAPTCPSCGTTNEPSEKFCGECGTALMLNAGTVMPGPRASTPHSVEPQGERKHITVLFADVAGSMDLQERLDAEVWAEIMARFVGILAEGIRKFGGTVDKFTGDGVMALFGAPVAQEDHARRACHAAWHLTEAIGEYSEELRREQGIELHVRLGLNSGEVVVGRVGEDATLDPTALGHTVGLAQRMEAMAEPGKAYLTEYTARLMEGSFKLGHLGPKSVKGVSEPLRVYVLGTPASSSARRTVGASPLIGRQRELAVLEEALALAMQGHAQVVGVVGDAGVGKSRLCEEFTASVATNGITVRRASGVSHGKDIPFLPVLAFIRQTFSIRETDTAEQARGKVRERLLALDPALENSLPVLFDFLEVPDPKRPAPNLSPEGRMRRVFDAIQRIAHRRSEQRALIVVFEDLHWFDPQSENFVGRLIESYPGSRTLVITNFRPEFSASWMRHSYYHQLALAPLGELQVRQLIVALLGVPASSPALVSFVLERTGGNPFFVEEVVRALVDDGILTGVPGAYRLSRSLHEVRVPPTIQALLAARLDRLLPEEKKVLQAAAVIGREFAETLLADTIGIVQQRLEHTLSSLCAAELVQRSGSQEYRFWHPLIHEVGYRSLLTSERRRLHGAIAEAMVRRAPQCLDERSALIASHFERAGEHLDAARWNARAATWARRSDIAEAVRRWQATLVHLADAPETEETLRLGLLARTRLLQLGARIGLRKPEADCLFVEGKGVAERLGDVAQLAGLNAVHGSVQLWRGDLQDGRASYFEATRLAQSVADAGVRAAVSTGPPFAQIFTGPVTEALSLVDSAVDLSASDPAFGAEWAGYSPLARNLLTRAELLAVGGRLPDSWADAEAALTIARDQTELELVVLALSLFPRVSQYGGVDPGCTEPINEAEDILEQLDNLYARVAALRGIGIAKLLHGQPEQARDTFAAALADIEHHATCRFLQASLLTHLAEARSACGEMADAYEAADEAVQVARHQGAKVVETLALVTRARKHAALGGHGVMGAVCDDLEAALALVDETGALTYEPLVREELGRLHADGHQLHQALCLYRQIGAAGHAHRLQRAITAQPAG